MKYFLCGPRGALSSNRFAWRSSASRVVVALLALGAASVAGAQGSQPSTPTPTLDHCAAIGAAADRLACYDKLAGRAPAPTEPIAQQPPPSAATSAASAPASTSLLQAKDAPLPDSPDVKPSGSLLSKYWELEDSDKRGIFNFVGYHPNYVLPLHVTSRINRSPASPTQAAVELPDYRREEAKFQLSLRTKLLQDAGLPGGDLWVAFTQQAFWQIYNGADSKPFRNSDYEPEMMYVVPTGKGLRDLPFGWTWRYSSLGLEHQSNGQSDPLSRSWNRVYLGAGVERGDFSLTAKVWKRLNEPADSDNNPDIVNLYGRGEFQLNYAHGLQTASLMWRSTLKDFHNGALQFEWTYPVFKDQPNGLRYFVQAFSGYGETLTDYNFRQTSVGAGFTFLQF